MSKKLLVFLLALMMVLTALPAAIATAEAAEDFYEFSLYYNYDYWTIRPWGEDETSKYWQEQFNIAIDQSKPDADADAKLNLMVSSGDLPDVILMERGPVHKRLCELGVFVDLAPLQAVNPSFDQDILASTQDLLKINDVLYSIPHWARKGPTGGNNMWLYDQRLYEAAGSPELKTLEDLYNYAKYVKDNIPTTEEGMTTIAFAGGNNNDAYDVLTSAFYRSFGGPNKAANFTARIDGKIQLVLRDPVFKSAVMELNKWYREGLMLDTQFSDTNDQMIEKFVSGRTALIYYDHSQDSVNRFRQILTNTYPDDTFERVLDPVYPPAAGVEKTYADAKETIGWNVHGITTSAEQPQRIFDLLSYMLTKQGSIEMMYGPQGDWWEEMDEDGIPLLHTPESELSTEEKDRIGAWFWSFCSHSDNVDLTKFAVNAMQPAEKQDWVISTQADILTPIMFVTDEYVGLNLTVDQLSDLGISRTLCDEQYRAEIPKIVTAATAEEAEALYDALLAFHDENNFAEVEAAYDARHQEIVAIQGFSAYD